MPRGLESGEVPAAEARLVGQLRLSQSPSLPKLLEPLGYPLVGLMCDLWVTGSNAVAVKGYREAVEHLVDDPLDSGWPTW